MKYVGAIAYEIEYYFVSCFEHTTKFDELLRRASNKGRAHMTFIDTPNIHVHDVLKICDAIISDFYPRLPHKDLEMATQ